MLKISISESHKRILIVQRLKLHISALYCIVVCRSKASLEKSTARTNDIGLVLQRARFLTYPWQRMQSAILKKITASVTFNGARWRYDLYRRTGKPSFKEGAHRFLGVLSFFGGEKNPEVWFTQLKHKAKSKWLRFGKLSSLTALDCTVPLVFCVVKFWIL